jgi:small subunit ribosomal protein S18e
MQNTNVNGKQKVAFALRIIKGIGRRFANLTCKIAQIDLNKRAGELTEKDMEKINDIITKPIGKYFLLI